MQSILEIVISWLPITIFYGIMGYIAYVISKNSKISKASLEKMAVNAEELKVSNQRLITTLEDIRTILEDRKP
jgi:TM2 domain-containing membrane protein YozV